ncbi:MAG: hypothetical protein K0S12_375, partial [Bacteroidetes bacterium]|nr:hypothetical protein [Bacteroidota bacterium]
MVVINEEPALVTEGQRGEILVGNVVEGRDHVYVPDDLLFVDQINLSPAEHR